MSIFSNIGKQLSTPQGKVVGAFLGLGAASSFIGSIFGKSKKGGPKPVISQADGVLDMGIWAGWPPATPGLIFYADKIPLLSDSELKKAIAKMAEMKNWLSTSSATAGVQVNRRTIYAPYVQEWINFATEELASRSFTATPIAPAADPLGSGVVTKDEPASSSDSSVGDQRITFSANTMLLAVGGGIAVLIVAILLIVLV